MENCPHSISVQRYLFTRCIAPADVSLIRITFLINPSGLARDCRTTVYAITVAHNAKFIHGIYVPAYIHGKRSVKNTEKREKS